MASLPAPQHSQRRASPSDQSSTAQNQQPHFAPSPVRTRSEDSQTVFLNKPDSPDEQTASEQPPQQSSSAAADDVSTKKCWICFSDSTEDTPETSPWRSPCPCALVAHEECLLDWIADMELPTNNRRNNNISGSAIQCPQCKNEIKLARPRSFVVDAVRRLEKIDAELIYPGAATVLLGAVYNASLQWGIHSIYAVFGPRDGFNILRPIILNQVRPPISGSVRDIGSSIFALAVDHFVHWRLYVGLPLIMPTVVLSRTTLADSILPVLPVFFFATQAPNGGDPLDFNTWPPSAGLAFSVLPYLRIAYNAYYRRVWLPKEKQWLKEIQPRARTQLAADDPGNPDVMPDNIDPDQEPLIEVRLDVEEWEEDDEEDEEEINELIEQAEAAEDGAGQEEAPPEAVPRPEVEDQAQQQDEDPQVPRNPAPAAVAAAAQQQEAAGNAAAAGGAARRDPRMALPVRPITETILGALLFPAIAGMSGELLKLALPRAWTNSPGLSTSRGARIAAKGLLYEKWGRSLVGGCLFVVLKDAVMLYVRWKMAQMHRKRRVLDWEGRKNGADVKS